MICLHSISFAARTLRTEGGLKAIPIQLPALTAPERRDASLEAGDWIIQLEPLVEDLSKHSASWRRRVMEATTAKYALWLHADSLFKLKIVAPESAALSAGFERLDQRVKSLLLQAARELTHSSSPFSSAPYFSSRGLSGEVLAP